MDVIVCDVVDLDACHLIVGRPCQFDVGAHYKGRDNVYIFFKGGKKFVLMPMQEWVSSPFDKVVQKSVLLTEEICQHLPKFNIKYIGAASTRL